MESSKTQHFNKKKPFKAAFDGLKIAYSTQKHVRLHLLSSLWVIGSGFLLKVSLTEWSILLVCIGVVICAELINTAVEQLSDFVNPNFHPAIGRVKDISAAAVLFIAIVSAIIGVIIFLPKILQLIA